MFFGLVRPAVSENWRYYFVLAHTAVRTVFFIAEGYCYVTNGGLRGLQTVDRGSGTCWCIKRIYFSFVFNLTTRVENSATVYQIKHTRNKWERRLGKECDQCWVLFSSLSPWYDQVRRRAFHYIACHWYKFIMLYGDDPYVNGSCNFISAS